jgi:hypothetical protein
MSWEKAVEPLLLVGLDEPESAELRHESLSVAAIGGSERRGPGQVPGTRPCDILGGSPEV